MSELVTLDDDKFHGSRRERSVEGEFIPGTGGGTIQDAHAPESAVAPLHEPRYKADDLTPDWVISRLMREATDHGTRSRQTGRIAALGMLAKIQGMLDDKPEDDKKSAVQRALEDLTPEQRRALIVQRLRQQGYNVPDE
jgi:hypothetical protein